MYIATINFGKSKTTAAIGTEDGKILERAVFSTTENPAATLECVFQFLDDREFDAIGISSFGPMELDPSSDHYGWLLITPKEGWKNFDLLGLFQDRYLVPTAIDTDVNAACLAESMYGAGKNLNNLVYVTIGNGLGAGVMINNEILRGFIHPEMGHIPMVVHPDDDFVGSCPFHHTCFEGLAGARAIRERWGMEPETILISHEAWDMEAWYIAQAITIYIMTVCPEKIILGGGIMNQKQLFPLIARYVHHSLGDYLPYGKLRADHLLDYIIPSECPDNPELCGGIAIAVKELEARDSAKA